MIIPNDINFAEWMDFVGQQESQQIHELRFFRDQVQDLYDLGDGVIGDLLPWGKTHENVGLRTRELTLWSGYNGHKKSLLTSWVMLELAKQGRVAVASMEMPPAVTLKRMASMVFARTSQFSDYLRFDEWYGERIYIYDQLDMVPAERILGFINYCATELKCRHIFIDSLTKLGIAKDDMNSEKVLVDRLQWAAKTLDVGIHLVCHMRKPADEKHPRMPTRYTIRGAGEISDLADNVFIVHCDKQKDDVAEKDARGVPLTEQEIEVMKKPDMYLRVDKQRNAEWEGTIALWHRHNQFKAHDTGEIFRFDHVAGE